MTAALITWDTVAEILDGQGGEIGSLNGGSETHGTAMAVSLKVWCCIEVAVRSYPRPRMTRRVFVNCILNLKDCQSVALEGLIDAAVDVDDDFEIEAETDDLFIHIPLES
jgi:hypothetical protein